MHRRSSRFASLLFTRLLFSLLFLLGTSALAAGASKPQGDPRTNVDAKHGGNDRHDGDRDGSGGDRDGNGNRHDDDDDDGHGRGDGHGRDEDDDRGGGNHGGNDCHQVRICHVPPGNTSNFQTITIDEAALQAHLAHGDIPGSCSANCDRLCDDGNPCTVDACDSSGHCRATHPPVNCDDGNRCTVDSCSPASGCVNTRKTCSDGLFCTVDSCDPMTGRCLNPPVCCPSGKTCDPTNGACVSSRGPCAANPCLNQGLCSEDGLGGFACQCISNGGLGETVGNVCACAPGCIPAVTGGCACSSSG